MKVNLEQKTDNSPPPIFPWVHYKFVYLKHIEAGSVQTIKDLPQNLIFVGRLEEKPDGWVGQSLAVLSWRIQTNKQLEHITIKVFTNLHFLQKLSRQRPFWDQATPSSLINKQFGTSLGCRSCTGWARKKVLHQFSINFFLSTKKRHHLEDCLVGNSF